MNPRAQAHEPHRVVLHLCLLAVQLGARRIHGAAFAAALAGRCNIYIQKCVAACTHKRAKIQRYAEEIPRQDIGKYIVSTRPTQSVDCARCACALLLPLMCTDADSISTPELLIQFALLPRTPEL
jgi:hypothetical protein